ncbi:MAG: efflux RND transporter periplasmic adaptor subunit [Bacteroidales bacterium]|nr:MAG: efflux RND transporter periplasmic adaptor subunit [Bacteroidales bacterium]
MSTRKTNFKSSFIVIASIVLLLLSCRNRQDDLDTEIAVPVTVEEVKSRSIEQYVTSTGTVLPTKEVLLKSQIPGYYRLAENPATGRRYALGDLVREGQTVIRLEDPAFENEIKIESQKLNLDISEREFTKQQSLYDKGGVTLRELKNAEISFINAKYAYENALLQLEKMAIKASFTGVIVDLPYYTEGIRVEASLPMVKIMDYSRLYLEIQLPEKELGKVKVNQAVRIMNYTLADDTLSGTITQLSPAIDSQTRTFKGSVMIANPDLILRPGMFVRSEIIVASEDSTIVIPKDIVLVKQRGKTVYVVDKGAAEERILVTGLENPTHIEVVGGLELNERLVISGFETLRNQSKVRIIR